MFTRYLQITVWSAGIPAECFEGAWLLAYGMHGNQEKAESEILESYSPRGFSKWVSVYSLVSRDNKL